MARRDSSRRHGNGRLLVVAGLHAAGKSTFLRRLAHGDLPPAIAKLLPEGAGSWPICGGRNAKSAIPVLKSGGDVILEYDLMRCIQKGAFGRDNGLAIIGKAREVTVVTLDVPGTRAARQLSHRYEHLRPGEGFAQSAPPLSTPGWAFVGRLPSPLRRVALVNKRLDQSWRKLRDRVPQPQWAMMQAYWTPGFVRATINCWREHVAAVLPPGSPFIILRPGRTSDQSSRSFEWQIQSPTARTPIAPLPLASRSPVAPIASTAASLTSGH